MPTRRTFLLGGLGVATLAAIGAMRALKKASSLAA